MNKILFIFGLLFFIMGGSPTKPDKKPDAPVAKRLKLLLVSDTHLCFENLGKFKGWFESEKRSYDYIIMPGDFTNILPEEHKDPQKEKAAVEGATKTLKMVQEITKTTMIFIPGNHEPNPMYTNGIHVDNCINIHKSYFQLDPTLVIYGVGGSIPAIQFVNGRYVDVWSSYPFNNDEEFGRALAETEKTTLEKYPDPKVSTPGFLCRPN